jgi:hypothetical protein
MSADAAGRYQASQTQSQPAPAGLDRAEEAAQLDRDNPRWLVVWGIFSLEFVAFPLFDVPAGTFLCARSAPELLRRIRQAEGIYGTVPRGKDGRHA